MQAAADAGITYGQKGDIPVPANYDGANGDDIAVFRPTDGRWFVRSISEGVRFGQVGDVPAPGDYDGNGTADFAVFRPVNATWYIDLNKDGKVDRQLVYGTNGDWAVPRRG